MHIGCRRAAFSCSTNMNDEDGSEQSNGKARQTSDTHSRMVQDSYQNKHITPFRFVTCTQRGRAVGSRKYESTRGPDKPYQGGRLGQSLATRPPSKQEKTTSVSSSASPGSRLHYLVVRLARFTGGVWGEQPPYASNLQRRLATTTGSKPAQHFVKSTGQHPLAFAAGLLISCCSLLSGPLLQELAQGLIEIRHLISSIARHKVWFKTDELA